MARSDDAQHDLDALGALIRTHRKRAGLTGVEAARRAGFTQSKLSKIENGLLLPGVDDVRRLVGVLGMDAEAAAQALDLIERLQDHHAAQRVVLRRGTFTELTTLVDKLGATGYVVAADPALVPDWLRTRDYLLAAAGPLSQRNAKAATSLVRKRQRLLTETGLRLELFVFEPALHTRIGSLRVMADQLRDAAARAERNPNVVVRLVNTDAVVTPSLQHSFEMHDDRQVVISTIAGVVVITSNDDVRPFRQVAASMRARALSEHLSRHYLRQLGGLYDVLDRIDHLPPLARASA